MPGGVNARTCIRTDNSATACGGLTNTLIVPDEWVTIMIHVKVGRPAWYGIPVTSYHPRLGQTILTGIRRRLRGGEAADS